MILALADLAEQADHDVCIVGAGPIGIALALSCADRGLRVLLLESGQAHPDKFHRELSRGVIRNRKAHADLREANCRALGGTSWWWGGRCVPLDPIDFETRPAVPNAAWPIPYAEIAARHAEAAAFFRCGVTGFSKSGPWTNLAGLRFDELERWCRDPNMGRVHMAVLQTSGMIRLVLGATVTDLPFSSDLQSVQSVKVVGRQSGGTSSKIIPVNTVIIACGGAQTPRLLLAAQRRAPHLFGGANGPLGRFYMGHIFGKIADIVLDDPAQGTALDFFIDGGAWVRRRFTLPPDVQRREQLLNIAFAAGNARISDPSHCNGVLSMIWLALASPIGKRLLPDALRNSYVGPKPRPYGKHLRNVGRAALPTAVAAAAILRERYVSKPGKPAVFLWNADGRYSLFYQSEQTPRGDSRLRLASEADALGMPRLEIDFAFTRDDADRVVRSHEVLDRALRANGIGRVELHQDRAASVDSVLDQARDGMHQIGAARMSDDPARGVVDRHCRVHGLDNLYLASTCVFPSGGHANPTFTGVALAVRLAERLAVGLVRKAA